MTNLTDLAIRHLKATSGERLVSDGNGLYLRIRADSQPKTWLFRYTQSGKTKKIQIGTHPAISLRQARQRALELSAEHQSGLDPASERKRRQSEKKAAEAALERQSSRETIAGLFERWAELELKTRKDRGSEVKRAFTKDVLPTLGPICVADLTKADVLKVIDGILGRSSNRMAKIVFALIRQMLRFAIDREIIASDPTASIRKSKIGGKTTERERVLSDQEILKLKHQLPHSGLKEQTQIAIWIALSTCCRVGELLKARWADINLEEQSWQIPKENSKNAKPHIVWLSPFAVEQFARLKKHQDIEEALDGVSRIGPSWLFPNRSETGHLDTKTISKQIGDRQRSVRTIYSKRANQKTCSALCLENGAWNMHDLRRTGATLMVANGALPEVAERCLNHTEQNRLKRIYQRHSYQKEMKGAWELLGEHLSRITKLDSLTVVQRPQNNQEAA